MKRIRRGVIAAVTVLLLSSFTAFAQTTPTPVPPPPLPPGLTPRGAFYSLQLSLDKVSYPPLPFAPYKSSDESGLVPMELIKISDGAWFYDDTSIDYDKVRAERFAEELLEAAVLELEEGLASRNSAMNMNMAYSSEPSTRPYLTNLVVALSGTSTASFDVAGGTNNVPYEIVISTNVADPISSWSFLKIAYTGMHFTFSNQPADFAFYALAKPSTTSVIGWGNDSVGQCTLPTGLSNAVAVVGGGGQSLALLTDGIVVAWGQNAYGQGSVPTNLGGATMLAAGWYHNVALLTNGTVTAWGWNGAFFGYNLTNVPPDLTNATVVSAQALHSLALRSNGTVVAWGYNSHGETNVPTGLSNVVAIAAGYQHNLAVKDDGTVVAWGLNSSGQTNVPAGLSNVWDVAGGIAHSLALKKDGTVVAWGGNAHGETDIPAGLSNVVAIAAGGDPINQTAYSLALKNDSTVVAWGSGEVLTPLAGLSNVFGIAGGGDHALAVRSGPATPVLTLLPENQYKITGDSATYTVWAEPRATVHFQWRFNGTNIASATNATLTLTNLQTTHEGAYSVAVTNEAGSITSPNATLTLVTAPIIVSQTPTLTNQLAIYREDLALSISVTAPAQMNGFPLSYQWKFNGTNISGATSTNYTVVGDPATVGGYSVIVTNAAGSANAAWQVTNFTFVGSYIDVGTLAYHLSTNLVARTNGYSGSYQDMLLLSNWTPATYTATNMHLLTNASWSTNFWLKGVQGLSATSVGISNYYQGQAMVTLVSPRHVLFATHVHQGQDHFVAAFLDTNNVFHWRSNVETVHMPASVTMGIPNDISVGILNEDLPSSVEYLPVLPTNWSDFLPTNNQSLVQGIGMNQDLMVFSQPTWFSQPVFVRWSSASNAPFGLSTNWNITIRGGDSSNPARLLIKNQMVLVSHNTAIGGGPNYALQINTINQYMHYLSTNNGAATDYQLTEYSLTNWPTIH